jgi:hypothetical protein
MGGKSELSPAERRDIVLMMLRREEPHRVGASDTWEGRIGCYTDSA